MPNSNIALNSAAEVSSKVSEEIKQFLLDLEITTPMQVNNGCTCGGDDCQCSVMELTISCSDKGNDWQFQTGDNSFSGGCYSHNNWSVNWVDADTDMLTLHEHVIEELNERLDYVNN